MADADCVPFPEGDLIKVDSPDVMYREDVIETHTKYDTTDVDVVEGRVTARPRSVDLTVRTERHVPRTGVMMVGWGGNNGTTVMASLLANRRGLCWHTRRGVERANFVGSVTMASTVRLGASSTTGRDVFVPLRTLLPMIDLNNLVVGGWDISSMPMGDAMERAAVLPYDLQRQLKDQMNGMRPLPGVFIPDFIAANQGERADNVLEGNRMELVAQLREQIRAFKAENALERLIVVWSANTERYCDLEDGVHDSAKGLLRAIEEDHSEVSPSTLYAVASIQEGCSFINGSPQNTVVPGVVELAEEHRVFVGGDDFKSGQTKLKSVLADFLVSAGIKPVSIVSYNHLGNNDGMNLSSPKQFRSKEISKSNVVDDMVSSNRILYEEGERPDHTVVIKYVPYVGDSKRAMDEYTSKIFMNGENTMVIHNTCEDSLLAAPLILDLVVLTELCERITIQANHEEGFHRLHPVLSLLSYMLKAPLVPPGTPVVNSLFRQREGVVNFLRACVGLAPENHMLLEHKLHTAGKWEVRSRCGAAVAASGGGGADQVPAAKVPDVAEPAMEKEADVDEKEV